MLTRTGLVSMSLLGVAVAAILLAACSSKSADSGAAHDTAREAIDGAGADPSSELMYEHFFYFVDEAGARGAEQALADEGFAVAVNPPGDGIEEWSVLATQWAALDAEQLDELTLRLESVAAEFGGVYDGWGAPIG